MKERPAVIPTKIITGHISVRAFIAAILPALTLAVLAASPAGAGAVGPGLQAALQSLAPDDRVPVIITLAERVDLKRFKDKDQRVRRKKIIRALRRKADLTQGDLKDFLKARSGPKGIKPLWLINGIAATVRADVIPQLAAWRVIESIRLDETLYAPEVSPAFFGEPEWNLAVIRAPELWDLGYRGAGVVVATMDTGVDVDHPDLAGKWRGGTNSWFDPVDASDRPYDLNGHGTGVMGVLVGGTYGGTAIGVAPDAQWIAVRIFNDAGEGTLSGIHEGFQWLLDPDGDPETDDSPAVVNNSWGFPETVDSCYEEFQDDIQALRSAGIAVVFSGGNEGPLAYSSISPGNDPGSFAVGAVDEFSQVASFSSRGPSACGEDIYPEVTAPGTSIRTSDLTFGGVIPNAYAYQTGTSFAAAHVAGAMALLYGAFPDLTVTEAESALRQSAVDLGDGGPDHDYGFGLIDVFAAYLNLADTVTILRTAYNASRNVLLVQAMSDAEPAGSVELRAEALFDDGSVRSRPMVYLSEKGFYRAIFRRVFLPPGPETVTVTSGAGGWAGAEVPFPPAETMALDTVTVLRTAYNASRNALLVQAMSDAEPAGSVELKAGVLFDDGSVRSRPMVYLPEKGFYRAIFRRVFLPPGPETVTVTSGAGGSDTAPVPFTLP